MKSALSFGAIGVVILAELALALVIVPYGVHAASIHPGQLLSTHLSQLSLLVGNAATVISVCAIASMAGVVYLSNQALFNRLGIFCALVVGLLGMYQLNVTGEIEYIVQKAQPTGVMIIGAFNDILVPAYGIVVVIAAYLVWYAWAKNRKALPQ